MKLLKYDMFERRIIKLISNALQKEFQTNISCRCILTEDYPACPILEITKRNDTVSILMGQVYGIYVNKYHGDIQSCFEFVLKTISKEFKLQEIVQKSLLSKERIDILNIKEDDYEEDYERVI